MQETTDPMPKRRLPGDEYTEETHDAAMSAVALIAANVCARFSCISARMCRVLTSSFSLADRIFASSSTFALSMASCTPISARRSSDASRKSNSSFSPARFASSCRMFDASCSVSSSRSAAFFCASSWATRAWWSLELCSSLFRFSSSRIWIVFCSSSHLSFSICILTFATSRSASDAFRFSTRSARASRSTASRNSSLNAWMTASCAIVRLRPSSRPSSTAAWLSTCSDRKRPTSASRRTKPSSVLACENCSTSTFATVRTIWSIISSRFFLLSVCSSTIATTSLSSFSIVLSQYSARAARCWRDPMAAIKRWLSLNSITFLVMFDTPLAFVQRRSGNKATALGMIGWTSWAMMPSCRFEKNLL
mmetsp:Transcript_47208/g.143511  ORF Transcript_47208/g.143511 Transcript_47208/m.143511 type:complete len:365 (-) Transcript_47208:237-1331(-)